jgi:hypothetical protein
MTGRARSGQGTSVTFHGEEVDVMRTKRLGVAVLCAGGLLMWSEPVRADLFQAFAGNTTGAPTFNRPIGDGSTGLSGNQVRYQAQGFRLLSTAQCLINSAQDYDGYLHLYRASFDPGKPLSNLIDGDDDGELGQGSSRIPHDLGVNSIALSAGTYTLVNSGFNLGQTGAFQDFITCDGDVQPIQGFSNAFFPGIPMEQQVWLHNRFVVAVDQISNHSGDGIGTPVRFGSNDSAFFWFYNDTNFEVQIKVLNACPFASHWWVFIATTSNQAHRIRVGDSTTTQVQTYFRTLGPPAPAVNDIITVFPCP